MVRFPIVRTLAMILLLSPVFCFAQTAIDLQIPDEKPRYLVRAEIVDGDTVPVINLPDVWIYAEYSQRNRKQYEQWTRTKYNVKKVYPYAILAAAKLSEYDRMLAKLPEDQRKAYLKIVEKQLRSEFEGELKNLTVTQGRILLKLIDRETGKTSYQLVREFRGGFQAFMWQGLARIFGNNMKSEYDAKGEDIMIEQAIKLVEAGQI